MDLTTRLQEDMKAAMKSRDKEKLEALRSIRAEVLKELTKGSNKELSEDAGMKMLQKLHKQRMESAELYQQQNREDLAEPELQQARVIEEYLPKQLSREEIEAEVDRIIEETGAQSMQDMGKVMGTATQRMAGKADGKVISEIVKAKLGN